VPDYKHPSIPGQLGIQSIPAVFAFVNGQPVDGFLGALPESQITAFIERLTKERIGGEEKDLLKAADEALAKGDAAGAADLYARVLAQDSGNVAALAGLARSYVRTGAVEQAKQTLALVPEAKRNDSAVAAARAALEVAEQAKSVGPLSELEQKVAANPIDHQARFDLAVALNSKGRRAEAVDNLLEIVKRDRKWNDDGARKQLVQFFEAWGRPRRPPSTAANGCRRSCFRDVRLEGPHAERAPQGEDEASSSGRIAAAGERRCR